MKRNNKRTLTLEQKRLDANLWIIPIPEDNVTIIESTNAKIRQLLDR